MKIPFETTKVRDMNIQMFNLRGMDKKYTFYYDETNNIRKFYLKENSFNSASELNFVLGGVLHEGENSNSDITQLLDKLFIQKSAKEIKLKHIAKGEFLDCIKSVKLKHFLSWLLESDLYVHITSLNIFYYSLVDIVDSAIINYEAYQNLDRYYIDMIKNNLYQVAKLEEESLINLLYKYQYPNIKKESVKQFIIEFTELLSPYEEDMQFHVGIVSLRQLLMKSISTQELSFIMNEEDFILLDDFKDFYMSKIYLFKNSEHIFDREDEIEEEIAKYEIIHDNVILQSYSFVNSHDYKLIQISDIFIGLFGKFTKFINTNTLIELGDIISQLEPLQRENLQLIHKIIDKSASKNQAFLHSIDSNEERTKYDHVAHWIS